MNQFDQLQLNLNFTNIYGIVTVCHAQCQPDSTKINKAWITPAVTNYTIKSSHSPIYISVVFSS